MRLKPVAPLNIQQAVRDTVVGGVELPAGSLVLCLMRPASLDSSHFPIRSSSGPSAGWPVPAAASASSAKRVSMPFGAGPRMCPGRYLALSEIKMAIAMLLSRFVLDEVRTADGIGSARTAVADHGAGRLADAPAGAIGGPAERCADEAVAMAHDGAPST